MHGLKREPAAPEPRPPGVCRGAALAEMNRVCWDPASTSTAVGLVSFWASVPPPLPAPTAPTAIRRHPQGVLVCDKVLGHPCRCPACFQASQGGADLSRASRCPGRASAPTWARLHWRACGERLSQLLCVAGDRDPAGPLVCPTLGHHSPQSLEEGSSWPRRTRVSPRLGRARVSTSSGRTSHRTCRPGRTGPSAAGRGGPGLP